MWFPTNRLMTFHVFLNEQVFPFYLYVPVSSRHLLFQSQQRKQQNNVWIIFKVNNKNTKTSLTSFWCLCFPCWVWKTKYRMGYVLAQLIKSNMETSSCCNLVCIPTFMASRKPLRIYWQEDFNEMLLAQMRQSIQEWIK